MSSDHELWSPLLRPYMISTRPPRLLFHQQFGVAGHAEGLVFAACVIGIAIAVLATQGFTPEGGLAAILAVGVIMATWAIARRWTELERIAGGWRIRTGIGRWTRRQHDIADREIMTCSVETIFKRHLLGELGHVLFVHHVALPFSGARPPLEIAADYGLPSEIYSALVSILEKKDW